MGGSIFMKKLPTHHLGPKIAGCCKKKGECQSAKNGAIWEFSTISYSNSKLKGGQFNKKFPS